MYLYHGTDLSSAINIFNEGIDLNKSRSNLDFGNGFYATDNHDKAYKRAIQKHNLLTNNNSLCPVIVRLSFIESQSNCLIKRFSSNRDWAEFVVKNRYLNYQHDFPIVCGKIADANIFEFKIKLQKQNFKLRDSDIKELDGFKDGSLQYLFHTKESLKYVKIIDIEEVDL